MRATACTVTAAVLAAIGVFASAPPPASGGQPDLDARVRAVIDARRGTWRDMNVPESDGRLLHDLILRHGYTRALEIGTSTGHSGLWIGWALAKTGGRLITIDIDERRHREAMSNFREAGLDAYIDARLGDAHDLVPRLDGPFDFVFIDADKEGYTSYARAVLPKLVEGGCLAAHNVSAGPGRRGGGATGDFYAYISSLPFLQTTTDRTGAGMSISFKRAAP